MSKKMPADDFRAVRVILEPDDFALGSEEPDPPPSDLIEEKVWRHFTILPDDVSVRTSNRNGTVLGEVETLTSYWRTATGDNPLDKLFDPMLDAGEDLDASVFNAIHGYYRCAFACLRNVLELMMIGTYSSIIPGGDQLYREWRDSGREIRFSSVCNKLSTSLELRELNDCLRRETGDSLFASGKHTDMPEGWSRRLYHHMCNYAHSRPGFAEADLWRSNGPIYVPQAFWNWYMAFLETTSLAAILILVARPMTDQNVCVALFTGDENVNPSVAKAAFNILTKGNAC